MKKILLFASLAMVAFSCSKEVTTEAAKYADTKTVSVIVSTDAMDTKVSMENSDLYASSWGTIWENGDALTAWASYDNSISAFSMEAYDMEAATFTGEVSEGADSIRLIYPYSSQAANGTLYSIDLSSQKAGGDNIYLISDDLVSVENETEIVASMKHVGAFVVLTTDFSSVPANAVLKSIEISDIVVSQSIDLTKGVDEDGFYGTATTGTIKISDLDYDVVSGDYQFCFNALPFTVASGSSLSFKYNFLVDDLGYTKTVTLTNNSSDLDFARATHNYINVDCGCSDLTAYEDGTAEAPIQISTVTQLKALNDSDNDYEALSLHYVLMNDIELTSSWAPIGKQYSNEAQKFIGVFDGRNFSLTNLDVDSDNDYKALFGYIDGGVVKNLNVSGTVNSDGDYVGGICGYITSQGQIINCTANINVKGSGKYVGGIVGYAANSKGSEPNVIINCINKGNINGKQYVGGIVGYSKYPCYALNCGNEGDIYASSTYAAGISSYWYTSDAVNCYNTGNVSTAVYYYFGGLIGTTTSAGGVYNSYSTASLSTTSSSTFRAGSIIGNNVGSCFVVDCYWNADIYTTGIYSDSSTNEGTTVATGMTTTDMQGAEFVNTLNAKAAEMNSDYDGLLCKWVYNEGGYPTLDFDAIP